MVRRIGVEEFVELSTRHTVLDVRSPGEFQKGHIPGAHSFPLFTDEERSEVGTLYKQMGQSVAMEKGMSFVGPKVDRMFKEGVSLAKEGKLLVHCWRGGKRSEAVAGLLAVSGLEVFVLEGGYKAFRNWVLRQFAVPQAFHIVGGMTGTGKTGILQAIGELGHPVIDLEALADHRGSVFGKLGLQRKVPQAQFENDLAVGLNRYRGQKIWLEDESRAIGFLILPSEFWAQMCQAPVEVIELPLSVRTEILLKDYGDFPASLLKEAVMRIGKRLGGLRLQQTLESIEAGDAATAVELLLSYYDKKYGHGLDERKPAQLRRHIYDVYDAEQIARDLVEKDGAAEFVN